MSHTTLIERSILSGSPLPVFTHRVTNKSTGAVRFVRSEDEAIALAMRLSARGHGATIDTTEEGEILAYLAA